MTQTLPIASLGRDFPVALDIESSSTAVRGALEACEAIFKHAQLSCDMCGTAQLILGEALNNIVEHAYLERPDGHIHLGIEKNETGLEFTLSDVGAPMPNLEIPQTELPDSSGPLDTLPEGGFGWFLIRQLTHNLVYERRDGTNFLSFQLLFPDV